MRIISGKYKSTKLFISTNKNTRPLKDMVKESIFNTLVHSNKFLINFKKTNILDLFSGTGSFGLECLSREAKKVTFVENDEEAKNILLKKINKIKIENPNKINVISRSVSNFINCYEGHDEKFDLIFLDPPYKEKNIFEILINLKKKNILNNNGIIILHRHKKSTDSILDNFKIKEEKIYGLSKIIFFNF